MKMKKMLAGLIVFIIVCCVIATPSLANEDPEPWAPMCNEIN